MCYNALSQVELVFKQGQCIQTQAASQHRRWRSVEAVIAGGMSLHVVLPI